jgi:general secretion pathway protein D
VPHIVRGPDIQADSVRSIATGTESIYKLSYAPAAQPKPQPQEVKPPASPAGVPPAAPKPVQPSLAPGGDAPRTAPPPPLGAAPPPIQGNLELNQAVPGLARPSAGPGTPVLALKASAAEMAMDGTVTVNVQIDNVTELFSAPMRIKYDNKVLKLVEINRGDFLSGDGQQVTFSQTKAEQAGAAIIGMNRVPGAGGISGSGNLVTLKFQAIGKGVSAISFEDLTLRDARLQTITVTPPSTAITVK